MNDSVHVIADDVTGACDVGAELATAGLAVRVRVDGATIDTCQGEVRVVNTQSRMLDARAAYARVLGAVRGRAVRFVLKKIDTALRGHLGAELDAVLDGSGAMAAFVVAAIPAAGRVTRGGCQWFGDRLLGDTEFARDPEGVGAESSIVAVLARESRRRAEVIGRGLIADGSLEQRVGAVTRSGPAFFVVDAESDDDVARAVEAVLSLARPVCLAGSITLAAALAARLAPASAQPATREGRVSRPALVVSGSLHSRARAQLDAALRAGLAVEVPVPSASPLDGVVTTARELLVAGRSVVLAAPATVGRPDAPALRATEQRLAELTKRIVSTAPVATLVLIGGETSYAALATMEAHELALQGRIAPLIAVAEILEGPAKGIALVTKGGSGGEVCALADMLAGVPGTSHSARGAG